MAVSVGEMYHRLDHLIIKARTVTFDDVDDAYKLLDQLEGAWAELDEWIRGGGKLPKEWGGK